MEEFEFIDPENGAKVTLPKKIGEVDLQVLIGHVIGKTRKDAASKLGERTAAEKEAIERQYQERLQELSEKLEALEATGKTQKEKEEQAQKKILDQFQKQLNEEKARAEKNYGLFRETKISNDLFAAMPKGLMNPHQAALLLRTMGSADLVEANGGFETKIKMAQDGIEEMVTPKEAWERWIKSPENAHHIEANLRAGGGTPTNRQQHDGATVFKRSELSDERVRKERMELEKKGVRTIITD